VEQTPEVSANFLHAMHPARFVDFAIVRDIHGPIGHDALRAAGDRRNGGMVEVRPALGDRHIITQCGPVHVMEHTQPRADVTRKSKGAFNRTAIVPCVMRCDNFADFILAFGAVSCSPIQAGVRGTSAFGCSACLCACIPGSGSWRLSWDRAPFVWAFSTCSSG